jgi:cation diffusion facilitator CzcD-associated flavoprotein CzcO
MSTGEGTAGATRTRIAIIGGGFAGLGMAVRLKQAGIDDFVILERADALGGTWRDNTYPGCAVDVQSHLYSFSFAPNPSWSAVYAPQQEIWDYILRVVDEHDVMPHVRLGHDVTGGEWDEGAGVWHLQTSGGAVDAQVLISGMGPLSNPVPPTIPGLDTFAGHCFHSARWDHGHDLRGRRVGVIGTGSSAAQFIPAIQPQVQHLTVFQRTPGWTLPRGNRRISRLERAVYRRFPAVQAAIRRRQFVYREGLGLLLKDPRRGRVVQAAATARLRLQVKDPVLRAKLTPDYRAGCKRLIVTDAYYPALAQPNVELVADPISEIRPHAVVTADGAEHVVDTLILGTGFQIMPVADPLRGRDGVPLAERWSARREAYLGVTVAGYPNYFMLIGPNTATGHTSALLYAEAQIEYVLQALAHLERTGTRALDVRPEVQRAYTARLRDRLRGTIWTAGGCNSWYLDDDGGSSVLWPGTTWEFQRALATFEPADYVSTAAPEPVATAA